MNNLKNELDQLSSLLKQIQSQEKEIDRIIKLITYALKKNKKVMICGNGGSAAEAQHLAAEFVVRLNPKVNRKAFPIIPLGNDASTLTACSNDYDFKYIFKRNFEAIKQSGDILLTLSTSGNSKNIIEVLKCAKKNKIKSVSLLGMKGGLALKNSDYKILIQNNNPGRIQECHLFLGHYILNEVEKKLLQ